MPARNLSFWQSEDAWIHGAECNVHPDSSFHLVTTKTLWFRIPVLHETVGAVDWLAAVRTERDAAILATAGAGRIKRLWTVHAAVMPLPWFAGTEGRTAAAKLLPEFTAA